MSLSSVWDSFGIELEERYTSSTFERRGWFSAYFRDSREQVCNVRITLSETVGIIDDGSIHPTISIKLCTFQFGVYMITFILL